MKRDAAGVHVIEPFDPNWPDCMLCHDTGIHDHEGTWKFCGCPKGRARRVSEPSACGEPNENARKIGLQK